MSLRTTPQLPKVGGISILPMFPAWLALTQGDVWHVRPKNGSDVADGKSPRTAFKTLAKAHSAAHANQNDIVLLYSESNTAADTTDYQAATLVWSKDMVHLIGVGAGGHLSMRARIALAANYSAAGPLATLAANGCYFANLELFAGVANATPKGCLKITGQRNHFERCHIAGIGNDLMDTADAYTLWLSGAAENLFENCEIGLDTTAAGSAANREIYVDGAAARNKFKDCTFRRLIEHASNHPLVELKDATSIDRDLTFENCKFLQMSVNYAIAATAVMKIPALTQGFIHVFNSTANMSDRATPPKWDANDNDRIQVFNSPTPAADTAGIARAV